MDSIQGADPEFYKELSSKNDRILNVGAGDQEFGTDFVDLYPQRDEVRKVNVDKEDLPYEDNSFDIVFSRNIFEHLQNPGHVFSEMNRVKKEDGAIIIITDNANYWRFACNKSVHRGGYRSNGFGEEDTHYALYTDIHLENFARTRNMTYNTGYISPNRNWKEKLVDKAISMTKFNKLIQKRVYLIAR